MTCTKYTQDPAKRKISLISPNFPLSLLELLPDHRLENTRLPCRFHCGKHLPRDRVGHILIRDNISTMPAACKIRHTKNAVLHILF